jgi:hypothetical protein
MTTADTRFAASGDRYRAETPDVVYQHRAASRAASTPAPVGIDAQGRSTTLAIASTIGMTRRSSSSTLSYQLGASIGRRCR